MIVTCFSFSSSMRSLSSMQFRACRNALRCALSVRIRTNRPDRFTLVKSSVFATSWKTQHNSACCLCKRARPVVSFVQSLFWHVFVLSSEVRAGFVSPQVREFRDVSLSALYWIRFVRGHALMQRLYLVGLTLSHMLETHSFTYRQQEREECVFTWIIFNYSTMLLFHCFSM